MPDAGEGPTTLEEVEPDNTSSCADGRLGTSGV